ncbi:MULTISPECIES: hypothetical protein [unclassified Streptomyces]
MAPVVPDVGIPTLGDAARRVAYVLAGRPPAAVAHPHWKPGKATA